MKNYSSMSKFHLALENFPSQWIPKRFSCSFFHKNPGGFLSRTTYYYAFKFPLFIHLTEKSLFLLLIWIFLYSTQSLCVFTILNPNFVYFELFFIKKTIPSGCFDNIALFKRRRASELISFFPFFPFSIKYKEKFERSNLEICLRNEKSLNFVFLFSFFLGLLLFEGIFERWCWLGFSLERIFYFNLNFLFNSLNFL